MNPAGRIVVAKFKTAGQGVLKNLRTVAQPKCSWVKGAHMHPFLSPGGTKGLFNSDESGVLQAYMFTGFQMVIEIGGCPYFPKARPLGFARTLDRALQRP
jgi:hypothetical protein